MTFRFSLFGATSFLLYCPEGLNIVYLSEITATTFTFRDRTADVTYYADVTIFLHATLGGLSSTAAFFSAPISLVLLLEMLFGLIFLV